MEYNNSYIFIKPKRNTENSFYYFIKNSRLELLSDSSAFSFVYKCHFMKSPDKSPYFYLDSKNKTNNIIEIIIKCLLLNDRRDNTNDDDHYWYYKRSCETESKRCFDIKSRFLEEIFIQLEASKKGIYNLNRNVPIVLYSTIFENFTDNFQILSSILSYKNNKNPINQMLIELEKKNPNFKKKSIFSYLYSFFKPNYTEIKYNNSLNYYFGIIAMEYITPNYKSFCDIIKPIIIDEIISKPENKDLYKYDSLILSTKSERLRWMYNTARYEILRLAIDTGYSQGDYHTDNILIDENMRKSIIIDFGKAKKINNYDEILSLNILEYTNNISNIKIILDRIFYTTFYDTKICDEYMWLKNIDELDIDIIFFLHQNRMTLIENQTSKIFLPFL